MNRLVDDSIRALDGKQFLNNLSCVNEMILGLEQQCQSSLSTLIHVLSSDLDKANFHSHVWRILSLEHELAFQSQGILAYTLDGSLPFVKQGVCAYHVASFCRVQLALAAYAIRCPQKFDSSTKLFAEQFNTLEIQKKYTRDLARYIEDHNTLAQTAQAHLAIEQHLDLERRDALANAGICLRRLQHDDPTLGSETQKAYQICKILFHQGRIEAKKVESYHQAQNRKDELSIPSSLHSINEEKAQSEPKTPWWRHLLSCLIQKITQ